MSLWYMTVPAKIEMIDDSSCKEIKKNTQNINKPKENKNKIYYKDKAVVLTYHHISQNPFTLITIKSERFEKDVKMLIKEGFNVVSIEQLINAMQGKDVLPPNAVVITFDDGLESFYKYAFPVLKKYSVPALMSIITSRTENYKSFKEDIRPLNSVEIKEMYESGLVDIASHTHSSHDFIYINSKLKKGGKLAFKIYDIETKKIETDEEYIKRVTEDLNTSKEIIYKYIGKYPDILCFPFGHYGKRSIDAAKSCGFKYFITTQYGCNTYNSKSIIINRIRAGDNNLTSEKLKDNIIKCAKTVKKD
ncbi:polysaccharide deacetylase family protein [Caloramator quimbayensis]|nr:polysaccharide deacetylase family protein [Caloramator quimbayensis]